MIRNILGVGAVGFFLSIKTIQLSTNCRQFNHFSSSLILSIIIITGFSLSESIPTTSNNRKPPFVIVNGLSNFPSFEDGELGVVGHGRNLVLKYFDIASYQNMISNHPRVPDPAGHNNLHRSKLVQMAAVPSHGCYDAAARRYNVILPAPLSSANGWARCREGEVEVADGRF